MPGITCALLVSGDGVASSPGSTPYEQAANPGRRGTDIQGEPVGHAVLQLAIMQHESLA